MKHALLLFICAVTSAGAAAQAPLVTSVAPTRNQLHVARTSPVTVGFDQLLSTAAPTVGAVKIHSALRGHLSAATTVSGSTLTVQPTTAFRPGEALSVSVTREVRNSSGTPLYRTQVYGFTAAAGSGPGTFAPASMLNTGSLANRVIVADMNGDGHPDLVSNDDPGNGGSLLVNLNNGSGGFGPAATILRGNATSLRVADVDNDGDMDLVSSSGTGTTANSGRLLVQLNDGSGSFTTGANLTVGRLGSGAVVGDLNGDGFCDAVLINDYNTVGVALNNASGSFPTVATQPAGVTLQQLALADVDNDGDLDLLGMGSVAMQLLLNDGAGTFGLPTPVAASSGDKKLTTADIDGDGDVDVLTTTGSTVQVLRNGGTGNFSLSASLSVSYGGFFGVAVGITTGDIDGDGDLDLIAAGGANQVNVRLNNGNGVFTGTHDPFISYNMPSELALADMDGDGDLDLVVANYNLGGISVHPNVTQPTIISFAPLSGPVGTTVVLTGTNLTGTTRVTFNGVTASPYTVNSTGTSLTVTVPAGAATGRIAVTTPGGTATSAQDFVVPTTTAAGAAAQDLEAGLFPNPAADQFTVQVSGLPATTTLPTAQLCNSLGQQVAYPTLQLNGRTAQATVSVRGLPAGVYTLRIRTAAGHINRRLQVY